MATWYSVCFYDAAEFLQVESYTNVVRWAKLLSLREGFQRGRIINRSWGEEWEQVPERHSAEDIDVEFYKNLTLAPIWTTLMIFRAPYPGSGVVFLTCIKKNNLKIVSLALL